MAGVTRHLSWPSLDLSDSCREVEPVPLPHRNASTAAEQYHASRPNLGDYAEESGVFVNVENSAKAKSCSNIRSACVATAHICLHENNNVQVSDKNSLVTDGSFTKDCTQAALTEGTTKHLISDSVLPVKPPRPKRSVMKESTSSVAVDKISSTTMISVPAVDSVNKDVTSSTMQSERQIPLPKPRLSLQMKNSMLKYHETDQQQQHNEFIAENGTRNPCQNANPSGDVPDIVPKDTTSNSAEDGVNEKSEQPCDHQKSHDHTNINISILESGQNQLSVVENCEIGLPADKNSKVLVPSRAAPPPPLPKPKIIIHSSGSFTVIKPSGYGCENMVLLDPDAVPSSLSVPELGNETLPLPQSAENSDVSLCDSLVVDNRRPCSDDEACKMKHPVPAVRKTLRRSSDVLNHSYSGSSCRGTRNVRSRTSRRRSEGSVHSREDTRDIFSSTSSVSRHSLSRGSFSGSAGGDSMVRTSSDLQSATGHEMYGVDTPPITPAVLALDVNDEEARLVC